MARKEEREEEARFRCSFPLPKLFLFVSSAVEEGNHISRVEIE